MTSPEKPINPQVTHAEKTIRELEEYEKILQDQMIRVKGDYSEQGQKEWMKTVDALTEVRASIAKEKNKLETKPKS